MEAEKQNQTDAIPPNPPVTTSGRVTRQRTGTPNTIPETK